MKDARMKTASDNRDLSVRLADLMDNRGENYILPFFWQHGEDEPLLREEMARIRECGIRAVCVEARPHPDFGGPLWWRDMDIIMDEARRHGMRVWLLDDAHFPTGFANGHIRDKYPEKSKRYLMRKSFRVEGPATNASMLTDGWLNRFDWMNPTEKLLMADELLAVTAQRVDACVKGAGTHAPDRMEAASEAGETPTADANPVIDLTAHVSGGRLHWDIPEGDWRVDLIITTRNWGGNPDYINPIDAESVRVLINAVHVPHWERYSADFGRTFAGFFSDEPSFGNTKGFSFDESIGRREMALPWSAELPDLMETALGAGWIADLPALWTDIGPRTARVRLAYMEIVTRLYAENFAGQIGRWCSQHGVEYIGHVIEDQNVHARLGCGAGHFYRAIDGQHMAGIDIIAQQVWPRRESFDSRKLGHGQDYEFFHFGLAKMGSSAAHVDPKKKGRTMCEIFGASGWSSGARVQKFLIDHALVRGVNVFVPHAFSAKEFPDPDCPPHFYARGMNPQFRPFAHLMRYTNRMCHLLSGGLHVADTAILYHAEAEWCGDWMFFQKPAHELTRNQIDYDVLPADVFAEPEKFGTRLVSDCGGNSRGGSGGGAEIADEGHSGEGAALVVNGERYRSLIVPYAQVLKSVVAVFLETAVQEGLPVFFVDARPEGLADAPDAAAEVRLMKALAACGVVPLKHLAERIRGLGLAELTTEDAVPYLRTYHYRNGTKEAWMFFNEHPTDALSTTVRVPALKDVIVYDAFENRVSRLRTVEGKGVTSFDVTLSAFESMMVLSGVSGHSDAAGSPGASRVSDPLCASDEPCMKTSSNATHQSGEAEAVQTFDICGPWTLSTATAKQWPEFHSAGTIDALAPMSAPGRMPDFSGTFRYETTFNLNPGILSDLENGKTPRFLEFGEVGETLEITLNGTPLGMRICPPYRYEISALLKPGENILRADVSNTLVNALSDGMSLGLALPSSGLMGPVRVVASPGD